MAGETALSAMLLGLTLLLAKIGEDLAKRLGIPSFIGAVLIGIIIGPAVIGLVNPTELTYIKLFIMLGIDFLLFIAGAEELAEAFRKRPSSRLLAFSILLLIIPTIVVALVVHLVLHEPLPLGISLGIIMGIVSVGPMVKTLIETGELKKPVGIKLVTLGILAEALGIVMFNAVGNNLLESLKAMAVTLVFLTALYYFGKRVFPAILHIVERASWAGEASFAVIIALILTTGYLAELLGFNAAVVSLILGVFASSYLRERPDHMEKLKAFTYGFFEPLFFAGIGLYMSKIDSGALAIALILILLLAVTKMAVTKAFDPSLGRSHLFLILAKGGVDAALLATLLTKEPENGLPPQLYTASVIAIISLAILSALPFRGVSAPSMRRDASFWGQPVSSLQYLPIYISIDDTLRRASSLLSDYPSLIVTRDGEPVGYITQSDLLYIDPQLTPRLRVAVLEPFKPVPIVQENDTLYKAMVKMYESESNVVAIVDKQGRIKGALYARQIFEALSKQKLVSEE